MDKTYLEWKRKQTEERIKFFNHINRKYGIDFVPTDKIYQVFEETVLPSELGFVPLKTGIYARTVNDDTVHLLKLLALKGSTYTLQWGVSLSYVPHEYEKNLRWHKSLKSSRFDLFYFGHESSFSGSDWRDYFRRLIGTMNGEEYLRETTKTMWCDLHKPVMNWFSSTQTLNDILHKADEQIKLKLNYHNPSPLLVYALTLGRIGEIEKAREAMAQVFSLNNEPVESQRNLMLALERVRITS